MATEQKEKQEAVPTARATIATIATHMGLSRATVTHVLNGRGTQQRIRPETQRRVLEVAQELGYRANASARAIRAGRFGNIALIQSLYGQYFPGELLFGLTKAIAEKDLHLVLTQVHDVDVSDDAYLPHTMRALSVDGVLINRHVGLSLPLMERIQKLRIPAIFINVQQEVDCIHPDDRMGGRIGTEYLLKLGHERIAYVDTLMPGNLHYSKRDRHLGYEEAMRSAGKKAWVHVLPQEWHAPDHGYNDARVEAARQLLSAESRPSAVVAYELTEAMAVVHAARSLNLRIPEDLSLLLFHNRIDDRCFVPMHTVSNMMEEVGAGAVNMLLEKIDNPDVALPARVIPVRLLEGATCLPPRS